MKHFDPATELSKLEQFGEFGGVNPSITDSATYTFLGAETMVDTFHGETEGCFLYSRHWNPTNRYLSEALAKMEDTESAIVTSSGMAAISSTIFQLCQSGDEVISSRTVYGGTYALFKNFLPRLGIKVRFVNIKDYNAVKKAINEKTKVIYSEAISNPLLEVSDIPELRKIADQNNLQLVIDNTFSPMVITPYRLGAHIVLHSMTKFINGSSDCVAGCVCSTKDFISQLTDINCGATMLLGPVLDSLRAASIHKNLHTLHIRIKQHSANALYLAEKLQDLGLKVFYPGLADCTQHELMKSLMNAEFGFGGMMALDAKDLDTANKLMTKMQEEKVGYLAVSLGYFKTLFSSPGSSTSSEIPEDEQKKMGLSKGLVRFSVGLDNDIELTFSRLKKCLAAVNLI